MLPDSIALRGQQHQHRALVATTAMLGASQHPLANAKLAPIVLLKLLCVTLEMAQPAIFVHQDTTVLLAAYRPLHVLQEHTCHQRVMTMLMIALRAQLGLTAVPMGCRM